MWYVRTALIILLLQIVSANIESISYLQHYVEKLEESIHDTSNGIGIHCRSHLKNYKNGIKSHERWALKMLDATSKLPSGIAFGNTVDLGSFDECVNVFRQVNSSDTINGKYCLGKANVELNELSFQNESLQLGLASCLPRTCSLQEMSIVHSYFGINVSYSDDLCQTGIDSPKFGVREYCGISFFAILGLLLFLSTFYDIYIQAAKLQPTRPILLAFSIIRNGKKLMVTDRKEVTCINGIRVISAIWIILYHKYLAYQRLPEWNNFKKDIWYHNFGNMIVLNSPLGVDTFFLLSGVVLSYTYLVGVERKKPFNIFKFYLHRYLRLTPVLFVIIIFVVTLLNHVSYGPLWNRFINMKIINPCEKVWWKSLLYVQNYQGQVICLLHTWYLSVDWQLYIISPVFLLLLSNSPKRAMCGIIALIVCNIVIDFLISWHFELNGLTDGNLESAEKEVNYTSFYYLPTYCRMAPWLIGIIAGYYLYLYKKKKFAIPMAGTNLVVILWICSVGIMMVIVFGGYTLLIWPTNRGLNSIYNAMARPMWALAISIIILMCANDLGGVVNKFLSLWIFRFLSQFTFTIYMIHYIIINILSSRRKTTKVFYNLEAVYEIWGDFVFSLIPAVLLTVAVEMPVIEIEGKIFANVQSKLKKTAF
ncbi:hypothetical protein RI129_007741 [Pyrocoelia pectoralis]|uniref:Nose resistant-to-fluoxetine protein N-terminal domain-containing protein n=1 Tax=Pyrocoelia pectoralis TaxID=417401 RepID=A0AAN7ZN23_9COLE